MSITGPIPPNIRKCMPPEERPPGPEGWTEDNRPEGTPENQDYWLESKELRDTRSEKELQRQISQYLTMREIPFSQARMDRPTTTAQGVPDFLACFSGRFIAIECKVGGNQLTQEQARFRKLVLDRGGIYLICFRLGQLKSELGDWETQ